MDRRKLVIASTLAFFCGIAFVGSLLLLKSEEAAAGVFVLGLGLMMTLVDPFVGIANYLIFLYIRPQEFLVALQGARVMLMLGGWTFALMILSRTISRRSLSLSSAPQNYFILWFLFAIAASHLANFYLTGAIDQTIEFAKIVVMYFLIVNLVDTERKLKITLHILLLLTLFLAVMGIVQFYFGSPLSELQEDNRIRGIGIFNDPNDLGLALLLVLPFAFLMSIRGAVLPARPLYFVAAATLMYALYLTQSRGGALSFGVVMLVLLTKRFGRKIGVIVGGALMAGVFAVMLSQRGISFQSGGGHGRVRAWAVGLDLLKSHPLFGSGAGTFTDYHWQTAHNSFVLCAAELGLFGLIPWVLMIYLSLKNLYHVSGAIEQSGDRQMTLYSESIFYGLVAFSVACMFLSRTYNSLLYIMIGLAVVMTRLYLERTDKVYELIERKDYAYSFAITMGLLFAIQVFLIVTY